MNKTLCPSETLSHAWQRRRRGNSSNVSPGRSEGTQGHLPSFIAPVFVKPHGGQGRRFFLLAVIFHYGQKRRSPLKRSEPVGWIRFGERGVRERKSETGKEKEW